MPFQPNQCLCKSVRCESIPMLLSAYLFHRVAISVVAIPCCAAPCRCLSILRARSYPMQCPRVAYPRKADPISALANLGIADPLPFSPLQCLRHPLPVNSLAIPPLSDPWRPLLIRRPRQAGRCFAAAILLLALPPQFSSVHLVRIAAHRGHPLRCLCSGKLFAAAARQGNAFPSQIQPFLCRSDS